MNKSDLIEALSVKENLTENQAAKGESKPQPAAC